jgi:GlcNAc-P-P-Und epimerase
MPSLTDKDRILITGASGFIGTNLMERLAKTGARLLNIDPNPPLDPSHAPFRRNGDIMDAAALNASFASFKPTHVIHLAARTDCDETLTVEEGYQTNTVGTANVLAAIKATPEVRKAIITSSQFVFNKGAELPMDDSDYAPVTVYGQSKAITERLTRESNLECCWTLLRPTNVWGPWHIRHTKQFFRILRWGLYVHPGREPVIRSYAYVGNVVEQMVRILEADGGIVDRKTFYAGDAPLDILDWVNGFSIALKGKPVVVIPRGWLRLVARGGDLISKITRRQFFITSSRFASMTRDYRTPMDRTFAALGPNRFNLAEGIRETVAWLESRERQGATAGEKAS